MTHVTYRLTAKNRDQLRNPTLGNRVLATFLVCTGPNVFQRGVVFYVKYQFILQLEERFRYCFRYTCHFVTVVYMSVLWRESLVSLVLCAVDSLTPRCSILPVVLLELVAPLSATRIPYFTDN